MCSRAVPTRLQSAAEHYVRPLSSASQTFTPDPKTAPVGQAIPKLEGYQQASGEAKYTDDIPSPAGTVYASYVYSTVASGTLE